MMKKISVESKPQARELVAVICHSGLGIYFRSGAGNIFVPKKGSSSSSSNMSLEQLLSQFSEHKGVYEGDTLTIQF